MPVYDWSQFHVRMYYLARLPRVFRCFSTATGLQSFFIHNAASAEYRMVQIQAAQRGGPPPPPGIRFGSPPPRTEEISDEVVVSPPPYKRSGSSRADIHKD